MASDSPPPSPKPITPPAPEDLKAFQQQFGKAITTPFHLPESEARDSNQESFEVDIGAYPNALLSEVTSTPFKHPIESVATYNQQYWFRLLSIMQSEFPLLLRLLGYPNFNQLILDYLSAHPPSDYRLTHLGDKLPDFILACENADLPKQQLSQAARLDYLFNIAFVSGELPAISAGDLDPAMSASITIRLQPHLFTFQEDWQLLQSRDQLQENKAVSRNAAINHIPDDTARLSKLKIPEAKGYWAIFRHEGQVKSLPLGEVQWRILSLMKDGSSLETAIDEATESLTQEEMAFVAGNISNWFADWTGYGWMGKGPAG